MPETKEVARSQPIQVMLSADQHARQELAREMAELKDNPLDRSPRRGGRFLSSDLKTYHDAEGRIIKDEGDDEDAEAFPVADPFARPVAPVFRQTKEQAASGAPLFTGDARESAGVNRALGDGSTEELGGTEDEKGRRKAAAKKSAAAPKGGRR